MILELIVGSAIVGLIGISTLSLIQKKKNEVIKAESIETLKRYGTLEHAGHKTLFKMNGKTWQVLFFHVPANQDLTVNSKSIWEIRDASKSRLVNQTYFLASELPKIVIIYPSTIVIKRYINENELVFVKHNQPFYNMNLVRHFELEVFLKGENE
jgi:hypothetical protein